MKKTVARNGKVHVTFELPPEVEAESVSVLGEFNEWTPEVNVLKPRKNGSFGVTIPFDPGHRYRYRFLLDGERWENDWAADSYEPNSFGTEDSVVQV